MKTHVNITRTISFNVYKGSNASVTVRVNGSPTTYTSDAVHSFVATFTPNNSYTIEVIPSGTGSEYSIDNFQHPALYTDYFNTQTVINANLNGWGVNSSHSVIKVNTSIPSNYSMYLASAIQREVDIIPNKEYEFSMEDITEFNLVNMSMQQSANALVSPMNLNANGFYTVRFIDVLTNTVLTSTAFNLQNSIKKINFNFNVARIRIEVIGHGEFYTDRSKSVDNLRLRYVSSRTTMYSTDYDLSISNNYALDGWAPDNWNTTAVSVDQVGGQHRLVATGASSTAKVQRTFTATPNQEHRFQYNLALLSAGSATVSVQQLVGSTYQTLATANANSASGSYTFAFTPTSSNIRILVSSNTRFALNNLYLDRDHVDTLLETYALYAGGYRYGFQGQEKDDEVSGKGNSYTAEFWQYSPRIAKRWEIDPMTAKYPWQSPYSVFNNNPTYYNDPLGLEGQDWIGKKNEDGSVGWKWDENVKSADQLPAGFTHYAAPGTVKTATNGMDVLLGDKGHFEYLGKTEAGNYVSQEGIELQFSGEDEANFMFKMKMKGLAEALDNLKLSLGAAAVAPVAIYGAIVAAPAVGSTSVQGLRLLGTGARAYHHTFGKNGGYLSMGNNILNQSATQFAEKGSVNLGDYDLFSIGTSSFIKGDAGMLTQMTQGASGVFVSFSTNKGLGGVLIEKKSSGYITTSLILSTLTPLMNKTPIFPSIVNEVVPALGQGVINGADNSLNNQ